MTVTALAQKERNHAPKAPQRKRLSLMSNGKPGEQVVLTRGTIAILSGIAAILLGVHTAVVVPLITSIAKDEARAMMDNHELAPIHSGAMPRIEIQGHLDRLNDRIAQEQQLQSDRYATLLAEIVALKAVMEQK